jgi:ketosteroid isomerase-like protein
LLNTDRQFAAAAQTDAIASIAQMLAADVTIPARGQLVRGREAAITALRRVFGPGQPRAEWMPIRGGISADGQHGFTFGYMTLMKADSVPALLKYLSYWVKQPAGWQVVAYRITPRPPGSVSGAMRDPALPARLSAPTRDQATIDGHRQSLIAAERSFSDRAQEVGLGPAFEERGSADAVNMGGSNSESFIVGSPAIGRAVSGGATGPSPVSWAAERAIVASSGDLGVTFGLIRPNTPPATGGEAQAAPFFTIWRRSAAAQPWRYIAE